MKRRIKVCRIAADCLLQLHHLERDLFEISVSDHVGVYRTQVISAPSFRQSRVAFTRWLHQNFPRKQS